MNTLIARLGIVGAVALMLNVLFGAMPPKPKSPPPQNSGTSGSSPELRSLGEFVRGPRGYSQIALTFDAGTTVDCFDDLLAGLADAKVHSTFFVTGNWAEKNRDCTAAITEHGHEIGNHTWNHPNLTQQSDEIIREEITRAESILTQISGHDPKPLLRAPYGARDARVLKVAKNLGYRSIYWTIDSLDGVEPTKTKEFLIDRISGQSDADLDGAIILMHVGERSTASALPDIISSLQARGFQLVTVSTLLANEHGAATPTKK